MTNRVSGSEGGNAPQGSAMGRARIVIVEDHPLAAEGLRAYLSVDDALEVVGVCRRGEDIIEHVQMLRPDIVILDLELRGSQVKGVEVARLLHRQAPEVRVLVVTAHDEVNYVLPAFQSNIRGYVLKTTPEDAIRHAVHLVAMGETVFDPKVMEILNRYLRMPQDEDPADLSLLDTLTNREMEVLKLLADEMSNEQIAVRLVIGLSAVKAHVRSILTKLGVSDRRQAVTYYHMHK